MRERRAIVVPLSLLLAGILAGLAAATQSVAAAYRYHPGLGEPWFVFAGRHWYPPWAVVSWYLDVGRDAPAIFHAALTAAYPVTAGFVGLVLLVLLRARGERGELVASDAHGTARWAKMRELERADLLGDAGVVLCQTDDAVFADSRAVAAGRSPVTRFGRLVRHDGPEHVMCFAPTRSGKGVGLVIPTMLSWPASVITWDVKRELWHLTAGWRSRFSRCLRFEPTDMGSARFNPLLEVRRGMHEVRDAQSIADMLVDPDGAKDKPQDHWQLTAHTLLTAAILHVLYAEDDKSLAGVALFLSDPNRPQFDTLEHMLHTKHLGSEPHPLIAGTAREMLNKAENELSGVFSTAAATLGLYRDPLVARATSSSDFRIDDLMRGERPTSLYLVVAPSDIDRLRPLMRLVINQIGRRLTESNVSGGEASYNHRLLMMLDEFPTLGRLVFFENALAYLAGYGIKCVLISQDLNQLEARYGDKNSILSNCHVRVTFGANDDHTAERISKLLGQATRATEHVSHSGSRFNVFFTQASSSVQEHSRPLLTAGEILQLPPHDALLFAGGVPPYRGKKFLYYAHPEFKARAALAPPERGAEAPGEWRSEWENSRASAGAPGGRGASASRRAS